MASHEHESRQQMQRLQVDLEGQPAARRLKISVESYAEGLGWYPAGSLTFPIHQLPLLEQALLELRQREEPQIPNESNVVPFPGLTIAPPG